jgi:Glycogen recognition site of AMP-activated protein kinase
VVKQVRRLLAAAALLSAGCVAPITVRPGGAERPTLFRVRASARAVTLSGTMTGWRPRPLERRGKDFELALDVSPGRYEYRLEILDDSGAHVVFSEGAERTADGFGGENAVLRVR